MATAKKMPAAKTVAPVTKTGRTPPPKPQVEDVQPKKTTQVAVAKPAAGGLMTNDYRARMAALVAQTKKAEQPTAGFMSFKNSRMSFGGVQLPGDKIRMVIVNYWKDNSYYANAYVAGESQAPACAAVVPPWAILTPWRQPREGENMDDVFFDEDTGLIAPVDDVQIDAGSVCGSCPQMVWGSARPRSDGKPSNGRACKESRRIEMIAWDQCTTPQDVMQAPIITAVPPASSLDNFKTLANEISTVLDVPIFGAVVDMELKLHDKYMFVINYKIVETVKDEGILLALLNRHEQLAAKPITIARTRDDDSTKDSRGRKF